MQLYEAARGLPGMGRGRPGYRALHVDQVAAVAVRAAVEAGYEGVVTAEDIAYLAPLPDATPAPRVGALRLGGAAALGVAAGTAWGLLRRR